MNIRELFNKQKLRCDDIISLVLFGVFVILLIFFRLILVLALAVYPFSSLFLYGLYKVYKGLFKKDLKLGSKILNFLLGIGSLILSTSILLIIFSKPNVSIGYIIYFLSLPTILIGLAAILKGSIVNVYSPTYRKVNIFFGIITIFITIFTNFYAETQFIFCLITLLVLLVLNGILRSGLYLSEYGLSLWNLRNLRLVFYIMDNLQTINPEDEDIR